VCGERSFGWKKIVEEIPESSLEEPSPTQCNFGKVGQFEKWKELLGSHLIMH